MLLLTLKALCGVGLLTVASLAVGSWTANCLPRSFFRWERITVAALAGFGLLSLSLFLVGQFSFTPRTILLVICILTGASARSLLHLLQRDGLSSGLRNAPKLPLIIVVVILTVTAVAGLKEITGDWNNDAVAYHLLGPRVWLRDGVIRPVPDNCHTAFPQTVETIYASLLAIGGARAPGLSSFVTFGMLLLIAALLAMRGGLNAREAWWVAALVATMPAVYNGSVECFVDGIYAAFVLAAVRVGVDAEKPQEWAIFGIFCGLAMGTKYTGLLALPVLVVCAVWLAVRSPLQSSPQDQARVWRIVGLGSAVALGVACLLAAPYYLRNWILLGCPIYPPPPGFAHFCAPKYLSPEVLAQFHAYIRLRGAGLGRGVSAFLLLPFNLTYHTSNFHGAGGIGLAPLGLGPIGLFALRKNPIVQTLGVLALLLVSVWFVTQQESRFIIHVYVLGAIFAVLGWRQVSSPGNAAARMLAVAVIAVSLGYGLFMIGKSWPRSVRAVFSPAYAEAERRRDIPFFESFQYLNNTPEVKKALLLDRSVPPFYSEKDYIKPEGQWGECTLPGAIGPLEAVDQARALGVSHILDVNSTVAPFQIVGPRTGLTLVLDLPNQRVYRVN
jgi:hypothetical protein